MKIYNVAELQEKLNVSRNWVYYRLLRVDKYEKWKVEDEDGKMAVTEKGYQEMKKEVEKAIKDKDKESQEVGGNNKDNEHIREVEQLKKRIEELISIVETQKETIKSLNNTIESLIKLNENNQILLLNEQSKSIEKVEKLGLVARLKNRFRR